nr:unnamed protein product [Digitaria exilis]
MTPDQLDLLDHEPNQPGHASWTQMQPNHPIREPPRQKTLI